MQPKKQKWEFWFLIKIEIMQPKNQKWEFWFLTKTEKQCNQKKQKWEFWFLIKPKIGGKICHLFLPPNAT